MNEYQTPSIEYLTDEGNEGVSPRCSVGAGAMLAILAIATDVVVAVNYGLAINAYAAVTLWGPK